MGRKPVLRRWTLLWCWGILGKICTQNLGLLALHRGHEASKSLKRVGVVSKSLQRVEASRSINIASVLLKMFRSFKVWTLGGGFVAWTLIVLCFILNIQYQPFGNTGLDRNVDSYGKLIPSC